MDKQPVTHQVSSVITHGDTVYVGFEDGHQAIFTPYAHSFGYSIEGLRYFELRLNNTPICKYHARKYRAGPQEDEHTIEFLHGDYSQQDIAEYWQSARAHIHNLFWQVDLQDKDSHVSDDKHWYHWRVTTEGWIDLDWLSKGVAKVQSI